MVRRIYKRARPERPRSGAGYNTYFDNRPLVRIEAHPHSLQEIYDLFDECHALMIAGNAIREGIFEEGFNWEPKYAAIDDETQTRFDDFPTPEEAEAKNVSIDTLRRPEERVTYLCEDWFRSVNPNGESYEDVLRQVEDHLTRADDAFLVRDKTYRLYGVDEPSSESCPYGTIADARLEALWAADPRRFKRVQNPETNEMGGLYALCLVCRDEDNYVPDAYDASEEDQACSQCGNENLYDPWYVAIEDHEVPVAWYLQNEVIHLQRYKPGPDFGTPPALSFWVMANVLNLMERHYFDYYKHGRSPRGAVFVPGRNEESFKPVWDEAQARNRTDKSDLPVFMFDPGEGSSALPVYVDLARPPTEMEFTAIRDEFYRRLTVTYGVQPIEAGSGDTGGFRSSGPSQLVLGDRYVHRHQRQYNQRVTPTVLEDLESRFPGITDYEYRLVHASRDEEMKEEQLRQMRVQTAAMMTQAGFAPVSFEKDWSFTYPEEPQQGTESFGGFDFGFPSGPEAGGPDMAPSQPGGVGAVNGAVPKDPSGLQQVGY